MSPSASVAVAVQVKLVSVSTPVLGAMETEVTSGLVLSTVTESVPVSVPPSSSVAVAVQVMASPGALLEDESVMVLPVPSEVPSESLVQA